MGRWRVATIVLTAVAVAYLPALANGFVWLDHHEIVEGAVLIHGLEDLPRHVVPGDSSPYFRPLYDLTHTIDRSLWGPSPLGFHLSSLLLHLVNVFLVFCICEQAGSSRVFAASLSALWGLHPVNSAVVGLVHAKADLLVTTFLLASALLFLKERPRLSLISYGGALLTKETAFVQPLVVGIFGASSRRPVLRYGLLVAAMAAAAFLLRLPSASKPTEISALGLPERLLTFLAVYLDYVRVILLPLDLRVGDTVTRFSALSVPARTGVLLGASIWFAALAFLAARVPSLRFFILLYHILLLPVSQIVPILHFRADRFLYLPSLAFLAFALTGARAFLRRFPLGRPVLLLPASLAFLYGCLLAVRLRDFRSDETLFTREISRAPGYREGFAVLGRFYDASGKPQLAESFYRRALVENPEQISYVDRSGVILNLAANLLVQNRNEEAYRFAVESRTKVALEEDLLELSYNQGVAAYRLGRYQEALDLLVQYGERRPEDVDCLYLTGVAAFQVREFEVSRKALLEYLRLAPEASDRSRVEELLAAAGR